MTTLRRITVCAVIAMLLLFVFVGCNSEKTPVATDEIETEAPAGTDTTIETDEPKTDNNETNAPETDAPVAETEGPEIDPVTGEPVRYSYLTGYPISAEQQHKRPVAIMINNIWIAIPQIGISHGEVYYECAAEGGITRIMMLVSDYENIGTIGSVRSSRDYFVDFLDNHDALYVHAGGSDQAYAKLSWRKIENLDAVTMYLPDTFWRDQNRLANMGYEHSLMTSGSAIASGIGYKGYRTEHNADYKPVLNFCNPKEQINLGTEEAKHIHINTTAVQTVDYVYSEETGEYLRYQYNGDAHIDGANGEQISVKNVIILFTDITLIPGDTAGRLTVETVGEGRGYYMTNGEVKEIVWSRSHNRAPISMKYADGSELVMNCGKTFINVVDYSVEKTLAFNYSWAD